MLNIADEGTSIIWVDAVSDQRWTAKAPSLSEWQKFWRGTQTQESLERGLFMWVNGQTDKEIVVVFSTYKGLDFNLTYSVSSGTLLKIAEAR